MYKTQRIRDPLHNVISFADDEFENAMWEVIQSRPFQRLRRVKQLGFSDLVYPGATHSRFAHSIGVFHTARILMKVIEKHLRQEKDWSANSAQRALAAALVHDVGHGPFSHAFEEVGKRLGLKMADHEIVSDTLIRDSELASCFRPLGSGFASDVADIIRGDGEDTVYSAVVSSQFDADRLDYMRRDRLMSGSNHGAIDFDWLVSNIEVGAVGVGVDDLSLGQTKTFVLGPKAIYAAEAYVLGLFHLYPAVYFHKATRGAEKLFTELLCRVFKLVQDGSFRLTGLPSNHPLCRFGKNSNLVENVLALDDTVIWGALSIMESASDPLISDLALRLRDRKLYKVVDVRQRLAQRLGKLDAKETGKVIDRMCVGIAEKVEDWRSSHESDIPRILTDSAKRSPYKSLDKSKGPLNQMMIRDHSGSLVDLGDRSPVVKAIEPFRLLRLYIREGDDTAREFIDAVISGEKEDA